MHHRHAARIPSLTSWRPLTTRWSYSYFQAAGFLSELVPWVSAESNSQRHCAPLMPARHFCCLSFVPLSPSPSITGEYRDDSDTICVIEGSSVTVPRKRRLPPQRRFGPMGRTSVKGRAAREWVRTRMPGPLRLICYEVSVMASLLSRRPRHNDSSFPGSCTEYTLRLERGRAGKGVGWWGAERERELSLIHI